MAELVYVQLEALDTEPSVLGWYAYFDGEPDGDDLDRVFENMAKVCPGPRGWSEITYEEEREEVPNLLSERTGLQRWFVANSGA